MEKIEVVKPNSIHIFDVDEADNGQRIDVYLSGQFASYSRSFFGKLIDQNLVKINNAVITKKSVIVQTEDQIEVRFPETKKDPITIKENTKDLDVKIVYDHPHFLVLNKPANLMVHAPNSYSQDVTLVDWIIANFSEVQGVGCDERPGIVHRLDKDTTGLILIAKNNCSHAYFSNLFKEREIQKTYLAIVKGHPSKEGEIDLEIARNPYNRKKMTHVTIGNRSKIKSKIRQSTTTYKVLEYFDDYSLVEAKPKTGRTHQIRVHFNGIKHPLLGDTLYSEQSKIISRQALHAKKLEFTFESKTFHFTAEEPKDFKNTIKYLREKKSLNLS